MSHLLLYRTQPSTIWSRSAYIQKKHVEKALIPLPPTGFVSLFVQGWNGANPHFA